MSIKYQYYKLNIMKRRFAYFCHIFCVALFLTACYKHEKVQIAQTFCIENLTDDTWIMEEITMWGGRLADSATLTIEALQSDSIIHFFTLSEGGATTPSYVPTTSITDLYLSPGCVITTRLINQSNGKTYEWEQELFPVEELEKPEGVPFTWQFVGNKGTAYNAIHVFKCVISPEN